MLGSCLRVCACATYQKALVYIDPPVWLYNVAGGTLTFTQTLTFRQCPGMKQQRTNQITKRHTQKKWKQMTVWCVFVLAGRMCVYVARPLATYPAHHKNLCDASDIERHTSQHQHPKVGGNEHERNKKKKMMRMPDAHEKCHSRRPVKRIATAQRRRSIQKSTHTHSSECLCPVTEMKETIATSSFLVPTKKKTPFPFAGELSYLQIYSCNVCNICLRQRKYTTYICI